MTDSLIFIPDISGFTEFTTSTEINHGSHIIADLFEIIVAKNSLSLELVEIEGDALLFVKKEHIPSEEIIYELAREMYRAFHQHLLTFDANRICSCGACVKAPLLTLKFFVHKSELVELRVGKLIKYHGSGMILIHRLMKNNVQGDDYILFTDSFNRSNLSTIELGQGCLDIKILGEVNYFYSNLKTEQQGLMPINHTLPPLTEPIESEPISAIINADMDQMVRDQGDLSMKEIISGNLIKVSRINQTMNYTGNEHICTVDGRRMKITTSGVEKGESKMEITENIENIPIFKQLRRKLVLEKTENEQTKIQISFTFSKKKHLLARIFQQKPPLFVLRKMAEREIKLLSTYYGSQK